jgi:hypothetical protein
MKANVFLNYYIDKNPSRQRELVRALQCNLSNEEVDRFVIYGKSEDLQNFRSAINTDMYKATFMFFKQEERLSFATIFRMTKAYPNDINILTNSDIIITEETIKAIKNRTHVKDKTVLALSRWDINNQLDFESAKLFDRADSQDTWVSYGSFPEIPEATFTMGVAGCDNKIAHLLNRNRDVVNAARSIKTYHLHNTEVRNYTGNGKHMVRLSPPYLQIHPVH